jgi:hypothetical protein
LDFISHHQRGASMLAVEMFQKRYLTDHGEIGEHRRVKDQIRPA